MPSANAIGPARRVTKPTQLLPVMIRSPSRVFVAAMNQTAHQAPAGRMAANRFPVTSPANQLSAGLPMIARRRETGS